MFSAIVESARKMDWGTWAIAFCANRRRSPVISTPSTSIFPSVGIRSPISRSIVVLLPLQGFCHKTCPRASWDGQVKVGQYPWAFWRISKTYGLKTYGFAEIQRQGSGSNASVARVDRLIGLPQPGGMRTGDVCPRKICCNAGTSLCAPIAECSEHR